MVQHIRGAMSALLLAVVLCIGAMASPAQATAPRYEFRNSFWRNMHQLLYAQARTDPAAGKVRRIRLDPADDAILSRMTATDREIWIGARHVYATTLAARDLLFDADLRDLGRALGEAGSADTLHGVPIGPDLRALLERAAPVYRRYFWSDHRRRNDRWRAAVIPLLNDHGAALHRRLQAIYGAPWPEGPVVVDLVVYANRAGAYTTLGPTNIAIATSDATNQGPAALEILIHETTHAMAAPLQTAVEAAVSEAGLPAGSKAIRRDLWHELLFYLTGAAVAERLPGYVPYADANDLWRIAWPGPDRASFEQQLKPFLAGTRPLDEALRAVVRDLAREAAPAAR